MQEQNIISEMEQSRVSILYINDDDVQNVFTNFEVDEKLLEGAN